MPDLNDQAERRHNLLNEMTGTVGSVLLGLQLGCAACHDHKYDPISQADFYRLRGILATGIPTLVRDKPCYQFKEQDTAQPSSVNTAQPSSVNTAQPSSRNDAQPSSVNTAQEVRLYHRGDHRQPTALLERGVPRIAADDSTARLVATAAHPRLVFADWLASASNPLPARVMANRVWQSHFGRGLAITSGDVGLAGIEPTHPELLDWLAVQLREHGWSVQCLRRQIVLSGTYRSRSYVSDTPGDARQCDADAHARALDRDPNNEAYSRYPRRRLTGEMVRDAMLQVAGLSDRRVGGPSVMPPLPQELVQTLLPNQWKASTEPADHARRSIYVFARRNLRYPIFEAFDRPDAGASCPVRGQSVTATQSLLMLNSELTQQVARAIACRVISSHADDKCEQQLWSQVLGRHPTEKECELLKSLLQQFSSREDGLTAAALALLNSNEFLYLD